MSEKSERKKRNKFMKENQEKLLRRTLAAFQVQGHDVCPSCEKETSEIGMAGLGFYKLGNETKVYGYILCPMCGEGLKKASEEEKAAAAVRINEYYKRQGLFDRTDAVFAYSPGKEDIEKGGK